MRYTILFLMLSLFFSCDSSEKNESESDSVENSKQNIPEGFLGYTSQQFRFRLAYPKDWKVYKGSVAGKFQVINIYKESERAEKGLPLRFNSHTELTFVSIFPQGYASELPLSGFSDFSGYNTELSLQFDQNPKESKVFQLDNGKVWGYYLIPENIPGSWYNGFIYAQIGVKNPEIICLDEISGDTIPMGDCDPLTGDIVRKEGEVIGDLEIIRKILNSFEFTMTEIEDERIGNLIKVDQPLPNNDISKPLTISGEARGTWYFEGSFPVHLEDKDGNVLAEVVAEAQGEWMTEGWVPFKATIDEFKMPDDERGYLVFQKDNPSGKPELDREFRLPVLFPPK